MRAYASSTNRADAEVVVLGGASTRLHLRDDQRGVPAADGRRRLGRDAPQHLSGEQPTGSSSTRAPTWSASRHAAGVTGGRLRQALGRLLRGGARSCSASTAEHAAMVGDDVVNDVEGARAAGLLGILVRTGKYPRDDLERGSPDRWSTRSPTCPPARVRLARLARHAEGSRGDRVRRGRRVHRRMGLGRRRAHPAARPGRAVLDVGHRRAGASRAVRPRSVCSCSCSATGPTRRSTTSTGSARSCILGIAHLMSREVAEGRSQRRAVDRAVGVVHGGVVHLLRSVASRADDRPRHRLRSPAVGSPPCRRPSRSDRGSLVFAACAGVGCVRGVSIEPVPAGCGGSRATTSHHRRPNRRRPRGACRCS